MTDKATADALEHLRIEAQAYIPCTECENAADHLAKVIESLEYQNRPYVRGHGEDEAKIESLTKENASLKVDVEAIEGCNSASLMALQEANREVARLRAAIETGKALIDGVNKSHQWRRIEQKLPDEPRP